MAFLRHRSGGAISPPRASINRFYLNAAIPSSRRLLTSAAARIFVDGACRRTRIALPGALLGLALPEVVPQRRREPALPRRRRLPPRRGQGWLAVALLWHITTVRRWAGP